MRLEQEDQKYVTSQFENLVLRFNGTSGTFIDTFVSSGSGGLNFPTNLLFQRESVPQPVSETTTTFSKPKSFLYDLPDSQLKAVSLLIMNLMCLLPQRRTYTNGTKKR
ncbi:hypothetical protein IQ277_14245 [Nostocales cyanobacterium LEGE 12452]|nr:hypothetical protein [Nostocales cyanobacterium LEGE 12452]